MMIYVPSYQSIKVKKELHATQPQKKISSSLFFRGTLGFYIIPFMPHPQLQQTPTPNSRFQKKNQKIE